jgi:hypothetical protein
MASIIVSGVSASDVTRKLLDGFLDTVLRIQRFTNITVKAMYQLAASVPLHEALDNLERSTKATDPVRIAMLADRLETVKKDAAFLETERETGYALVYGTAPDRGCCSSTCWRGTDSSRATPPCPAVIRRRMLSGTTPRRRKPWGSR